MPARLKVKKKERKLTDKENPLDLNTLERLITNMNETLESLDDPGFAGRGNATEEAELNINPYRLRHTCATILLVIGELPLQEITYRMGHSDAGFTHRVDGYMSVHLKMGDKGMVKKFWKKLNGPE